ncbi:hypothetical protein F4778DRAFT_795776 [Xylariomycetidae sp. FL2044]|nr:hypothetical protein F4778DRAFT_795776 [Xylariomycetidae sp. FL2044]
MSGLEHKFDDLDPAADIWMGVQIKGVSLQFHVNAKLMGYTGPALPANSANEKTAQLYFRIPHPTANGLSHVADVSIGDIWRLLTLLRIDRPLYQQDGRYGARIEKYGEFFEGWAEHYLSCATTQLDYEMLLFPAAVFNSTQIFGRVTKWLAYNAIGQISERNPLLPDESNPSPSAAYLHRMHLPKNVIRQIRISHSFLYNRLHDAVYKQILAIVQANCPCRIDGLWNFLEALEDANAFPFEDHENERLTEIILRLTKLNYSAPPGVDASDVCGALLQTRIVKQVNEVKTGSMRLWNGKMLFARGEQAFEARNTTEYEDNPG